MNAGESITVTSRSSIFGSTNRHRA